MNFGASLSLLSLAALLSACTSKPTVEDRAPSSSRGERKTCLTPVFLWTDEKVTPANAATFLKTEIAGSSEAAMNWTRDDGGPLAGPGLHFAGEPFSRSSEGHTLLIANLTPGHTFLDLSNGRTIDVDETDLTLNAVRSSAPLILYRSVADENSAATSLAVRAGAVVKENDLPIDLNSLQVVHVSADADAKSWASHKPVQFNTDLARVLQDYSDELFLLHDFWESQEGEPNERIAAKSFMLELQATSRDELAALEKKTGVDFIEAMQLEERVPLPALRDFQNLLLNKKWIVLKGDVHSIKQLKDLGIEGWKESPGYTKLVAVYAYLRDLKRRLSIVSRRTHLDANSSNSHSTYSYPSTLDIYCQ